MTDRSGIGIIGCGVIGSQRARILSEPGARRLHLCDIVEDKARAAAEVAKADAQTTDWHDVVEDDAIGGVIVATPEGDHFAPAMSAIEAGKHVLVEKPLVVRLDEAERLVEAARRHDVELFVGYTQRFRRRYVNVKQQLELGRLGKVTSAFGKLYVTRAVGRAVMERATDTSPALNTLTYLADLMLWYLDGRGVSTVYARGGKGSFWEGFGVHDSTWAMIELDDGTVVTIGTSWEPPEIHPALVATMEVELFGDRGMVSVDDAHRDVVLVSADATPSPYTPQHAANVAFLGSAMPGDWALGKLYGPMTPETLAFADFVARGRRDPVLATGPHGYRVLGLTAAIDEALATGGVIDVAAERWAKADALAGNNSHAQKKLERAAVSGRGV